MNAVPDSLIFDPNAAPTTPWMSFGGPISSADFIPVDFRGYSPDLPASASEMWNPFPYGAPASWSRLYPYIGGNPFAGGLIGSRNREAFFGIPTSSTSGSFTDFTGGMLGGGNYFVTEGEAQIVTEGIDTSLTLGGPKAPTYTAIWASGGESDQGWSVGPRPFASLPPAPYLTPPHPFIPFPQRVPPFHGPISFDSEFE
jgi:hypothetical protein